MTSSVPWQTSFLGDHYLPTNSPYRGAGSTTADQVGLYWYTTQTNQVPQGASQVDLGYHYRATDSYGNPLDDNGDNGNWSAPSITTQPASQTMPVGSTLSFSVSATGTTPLSFQWMCDGTNITWGTGSTYSITNVQATDAGTYTVAVGNPFGSAASDNAILTVNAAAELGFWNFGTANFANQNGAKPFFTNHAYASNTWSGSAVAMTSPSSYLAYDVAGPNGLANMYFANGTVRFWFQPAWNSGDTNNAPAFIRFLGSCTNSSGASPTGLWMFGMMNNGAYLRFVASNNVPQIISLGAEVTLVAGHWYQIAITYSPTNIAIYTNGVLLATEYSGTFFGTVPGDTNNPPDYESGCGMPGYPASCHMQSGGMDFGSWVGGSGCEVLGLLDDLETFNYPLTPQAIAAGFPNFAGCSTSAVMADTSYVGRSDMLQQYVDGDPASPVQCRLGYWRFDTADLISEQGQFPISQSGVTQVSSLLGTAANIGGSSGSQLTYSDVYTNGWANINCRSGAVRFWFKPNWNSGYGPSTAPFVYLGSTAPGSAKWSLQTANSGSAIQFVTATNNASTVNILPVSFGFTNNQWCQIVLTYGPSGSTLYTNGQWAATGSEVTLYPNMNDRANGMVIGNNTDYSSCINGQFEEMETFNYQLAAGDILSNFQTVTNVDTDLDGTPDVLEDIALPQSRPYLGAPVVIAGTIEAVQFDMGGQGVGYYNVEENPTNSYRPTGMFIANCDDLGGGYCLLAQSGEWAQYTINVLVAGTYTVEARVVGSGSGTFECDFANSSGYYTSTGTMPIPFTAQGWTNVSMVVNLTSGINVMRLQVLSGDGGFNYISIYPWWQAGFSNIAQTTNAAYKYRRRGRLFDSERHQLACGHE